MNEESQTIEECCLGCLCTVKECKLQDYKIKYTHLWDLLEAKTIKLCYLCKRIAQHTELFIQNAQHNQILLQNCVGDKLMTLNEARTKLQRPISLSHTPLHPILTTGIDNTDSKINGKGNIDLKTSSIKSKTKQNANERDRLCGINVSYLEEMEVTKVEFKAKGVPNGEFENDDGVESDVTEDDFPLTLLKKDMKNVDCIESNSIPIKKVRKIDKKTVKQTNTRNIESLGIKKIIISEKECMEERKQQESDPVYVNCTFKCENCIKGFNFKATYDNHMKKHSEETGPFICYICRLRTDSKKKLLNHTVCHTIRWKCTLCDLVCSNRSNMIDHHNVVHEQGDVQLPCPYCPKSFKRQAARRKHVRYLHMEQERLTCVYCEKSYANQETLKAHNMLMHPKEVSAKEQVNKYQCEECGMLFRFPTHVKRHKHMHSLKREFYCIECDKSFKSETTLKQHMKTTQFHVKNSELPISCSQCEKRFSKRRELERHRNSKHLDLKPFRCDQCEKVYSSGCALRDHKRISHEGCKQPLRYNCIICHKIFSCRSKLKGHIRTHTGERPYQCDKCPAMFSQSGYLATHNKRVHQRLTSADKP